MSLRGAWILCALAALAPAASGAVPQKERDALLAVYNSAGGSQWIATDNWNGAPGSECGWYGVTCNEQETTVVALNLSGNNLKGFIPPAVADLVNLEELGLAYAEYQGSIPVSIGTLSKLKFLDLSSSGLSGPIPPSLGSLTGLTSIDLGNNVLTGQIPPELGNLTLLENLQLPSNRLEGSIPRELGQLVNLRNLNLYDNRLSGAIPPELGSLSLLETISLGNNALTGRIPSTLGSLRNVQSLDLSNNQLDGPIPSELGNLAAITGLYLASNNLSGDIPSSIWGLTTLQALDLSVNQLTGSIPPAVAQLSSLIELRLSQNRLSGNIPSQLGSLTQLQALQLGTNSLTGPIPVEIEKLVNLVQLDVGTNQLQGSIPAGIGKLVNLEGLYFYEDGLSGPIPPELGSLTKLTTLNLDSNKLTGGVPDTFQNLVNLEQLSFTANQLSGPIPDWISKLTKLQYLSFDSNRMTGPIPQSITSLTALTGLDLGYNVLTGPIPSNIGNLTALDSLILSDNELVGPLPDSMWNLKNLLVLSLDRNHLEGPLSPRVAELTKLEGIFLGDNEISGTIPPQVGTMRSLVYLQLYGNHLRGTIPPQLGDLSNLQLIDLGSNDLHGAVPPEIKKLTTLIDKSNGFDKNALYTNDPSLLAFLNQKNFDSDFPGTQTVTPTGIAVGETTDRSATVRWTPIAYGYDYGGYQVRASRTPGGTPVSVVTTGSKYVESITVRNLDASTNYFFTVTTITYPHDVQRNTVASDESAPVSATTGPHVDAPADIVITTDPDGLVQIDGVAQNEDSFTVTNFGDASTSLKLTRTEDFFSIDPAAFTLAGGASQVVRVTSNPKPEDFYFGNVLMEGDGVSDEDVVDITLLSVVRPIGGAIAEALTSRVEIVEQPGVPAAGSVTFRNRGTVALTGILDSDVPWIIPPREAIQLGPDETRAITFRIDRTRRPSVDGTLTGTITLVYIGGTLGASSAGTWPEAGTPPTGTSSTRVVVVDITKPPVAPGTIPPIGAGEVAFAIPGVTARTVAQSSLVSDVDILNAFGSRAIADVRLYFANSTVTSVASLGSIGTRQSLSFANVVSSVYGAPAPVGALQLRTRDWQDILVGGRLLRLSGSGGAVAGDLPVFRSDRVISAGQTLRLPGIRQSGGLDTAIYLQELSGTGTRAHVDFLDASGRKLGERDADLAAFGFAELAGVVPAGTASAIVKNSGTGGGVVSYARVTDQASGDAWSLVDWRSYFNFRAGSSMLVPFVQAAGSSQSPGRRRAASHATSTSSSTELTLFNASAADTARVFVLYNGTQKEVVVAPLTTSTLDVASMFGAAAAGPMVITQDKGDVAITARISRPSPSGGSYGAAVPVLAAQSGLRVGQARVFANIEDPSAATIAAGTPGTFRAAYGLVETGGAPVKVRATISLPDGRTIIQVANDITLAANQFATFEGVVKSIIGDLRDTRYGDFHNLQLRLEVIDGGGSVVPFVVFTENATGDSVLRLE